MSKLYDIVRGNLEKISIPLLAIKNSIYSSGQFWYHLGNFVGYSLNLSYIKFSFIINNSSFDVWFQRLGVSNWEMYKG